MLWNHTTMAKQGRNKVQSDNDLLNHEEMNLVEYPIGIIADRPPVDAETGEEVKTLIWRKWITLPNGERVQQEFIAAGTKLHGLPRGFDFCVFFMMIQIWSEHGFAERQIQIGTIYNMLRRMGLPDEPQYYRRIRNALDRLAGTTFYTRYAIWDTKKKTYLPEFTFNIIDNLIRDKDAVFEELGLGEPVGTIEFTKAMLALVRRGYFKPTDVARY